MPGHGPAPKPASQRARRNADPIPQRVVNLVPAKARSLPDDLLREGEVWHSATQRWWQTWMDSPLSDAWTETEWTVLEQTALIHNEFVTKRNYALAAELRLREAKLGATPEDRARLRIVSADADEKDSKRGASPAKAQERYADLHVIPTTGVETG